jgi:hypothetical protein
VRPLCCSSFPRVRRIETDSATSLSAHSDVGQYDRIVIQEIIKEIAQTQQVDLNAKQKFKGPS